MIKTVQRMIRSTDAAVAGAYLSVFSERNALLNFLFHSLFRDENEIQRDQIDPLQHTTVKQFRVFIEYYLEHDYQFVSPSDLAAGLRADKKYAMISFDDGYYNNTLALPILEEYNVPAVFFVCSDNVQRNRCFWWDVLYRELAAQGMPRQEIYRKGLEQKTDRTSVIEERLTSQFGPRAFLPRSDIDRPFSISELRDFANRPGVHIGNHTAGHAILTNYADDEIRDQIQSAQIILREMLGATPIAIAYPNGGYDDRVLRIARESGLQLGFTTRQMKTTLPIDPNESRLLTLGRFSLRGNSPVLKQCRTCRSDLQLYGKLRDGYVSLRNR
jgi:peptidoglycan/xylan/chitin deacetylase (PgdA/CDA1 family)